ncbi:hypothetical protein BDZ89DRAFT_1058488 [Hymenopellis radicata]|nr:hypothetical protein BDZ89DRAFT_1058488 [Hymenopellis radicata]
MSLYNLHPASSSSLSSTTSSLTLRERRGVTLFIEFTRPRLVHDNIPAKGQLGPTAGSLPRRRRRVAPPRDIL